MYSPRFSVIIPVFNGAHCVSRAIESVLSQSYPAHEVIVVDDGATDDTAAVVAQFGHMVIYVHQDKAGVSAARNNGVRVATGDWLAFLDADDWYFPNRLKWHADLIKRDPGLDFLTGDYEYRGDNGALIGHSMERTELGKRLLAKAAGAREVIMEEAELGEFVADHFGDTHTLSVPRKTFLELGGYPLGRKVCEDVHFLIRLCARSKRVGIVCEPMGVYLIHDRSATRSNPVGAQFNNVVTLASFKMEAAKLPPLIRKGFATRLRRARLNLAYALVREGHRLGAIKAVLPSLIENPGIASIRDIFSVARG